MNSVFINPMTGNRMIYPMKDNFLLTYHLDKEELGFVEKFANDKYCIYDCSDDLTDLLAIPAAILVVNPLAMDNDDLMLFNEYLCDNVDDSIVVLTKPFPIKTDFLHLQVMNFSNSNLL